MTAAIRALRRLGVKKLAVAMGFTVPARDSAVEPHEIHKQFLRDNGFELASYEILPHSRMYDVLRLPPETAARLAREAYRKAPEADGIYITCGRLDTLPVIGPLEDELGVPVVTANQAWTWETLRTLGVRESIPGFGRLLETV